MNIKKVYVYSIIGLLILVTGIFIVNAVINIEVGHNPEEVLVTVDEQLMTLQEAIDTNAFIDGPEDGYVYTTTIPNPGHTGEKILIEISGFTMTLQEAITNKFLTQEDTPTENIYTTEISGVSHTSSTIEVSIDDVVMTLEEAITNDKFCNINYGNECGGDLCINPGTIACNGTCAGTSYKLEGITCGINSECDGAGECVGVCVLNMGDSCDDGNLCTIGETIQCDGSCGGATSFTAKGTNCYSDTKACDGAGNCLGWSGKGCGDCPFGSTDVGDEYYYCNLGGNQGRYYNNYWRSWSYSAKPLCRVRKWKLFVGWTNTYYSWQIKP